MPGSNITPKSPQSSGVLYPYDVCLSFAGEDRPYVDKVAAILLNANVRLFYDAYEKVSLWGKDLYAHLDDVYQNKARFCVMFISQFYSQKLWTNHERQSAQARAFTDSKEYILPVRFDNTEIPGIRQTVGYLDLRETSPQQLADMIIDKLKQQAPDGALSVSENGFELGDSSSRLLPTSTNTLAATGDVTDSGPWILLDNSFFVAKTVNDQDDGTIFIEIIPNDSEEEAALRILQPEGFRVPSPLAFAHRNRAALTDVRSVRSRSSGGEVSVLITLMPKELPNRGTLSEIAVNESGRNYNPDEIATLRARLLLLDERLPMPTDSPFSLLSAVGNLNNLVEIKKGIFPKLWQQCQDHPDHFRSWARLLAVFYLITGNICEHILELRLSPVHNMFMPIKFRGRRRKVYTNMDAPVIEVAGDCKLA